MEDKKGYFDPPLTAVRHSLANNAKCSVWKVKTAIDPKNPIINREKIRKKRKNP
jgi:hypothetical protein